MADTQSDKCPWESRFGGGFISNAQYLAETMCDRMARKEGRELQFHFWNLDLWKRKFLLQVRAANSLLKVYDCFAIIRALKTTEGKRIYSLGAKWLVPIVKLKQEEIRLQKIAQEEFKPEPKEVEPVETKIEPPRPSFPAKKRNTLSMLKDLE